MSFYKGFVICKNKKCIDKFKDGAALRTLEDVQSLPEYAGILSQDSILVDIDDMKQSEILLNIVDDLQLNCRVNQSRSGAHFLFKNKNLDKCSTKITLACGIVADIKTGLKNSYEILKIDGKERKILYDIYPDEEYQEIPKFLYPVKGCPDFRNMSAGDGRNQAYFNYILTLQSNGFTKEEARKCIQVINKYIVKDPLPDTELDTVLRDEAFQKPIFFENKTFLFDSFAKYLKSEHHIIRINNQLHLYENGIYVSGQEEIENTMIHHIPMLNKSKRQEVLSYLDIMIRDNTEKSTPNYICFANGIYNLDTDELLPYSPDYIITNKIPWDYNPTAEFDATDEVLNNVSCNDTEVRRLLEEMIGYTMFSRNELGKAFILTGSGKNGKSTFLNMLKRMLGYNNLSVLDMKKLGDRFSTVMLFGKLANIGDDISDEFLADASEFKKITTGEMIDAEQKGQPKFQFSPYCKLLFSANSLPRIGKGKDSSAILRRLVIVPFNAKFDENDPNYKPYIGDELKSQESMEYLIRIGLDGLKRVLLNKKFSVSKSVDEELREFEEMNNPVLGFFHEEPLIENQKTRDVYLKYTVYCAENSISPLSAGEFSKQVKKYFRFEIIDRKIDNKKYRIFIKKGQ